MKTNRKIKKFTGLILGIFGIGLLVISIFPIASYLSYSKSNFPNLISPIGGTNEGNTYNFDSRKASQWFLNGADEKDFELPDISHYKVSIPKLGIENATSTIGGEDLSKSLIHYPGTALPGQVGNSVIFGHSVLPIFYNPKNYLTIFSKLSDLKKGDEIGIDYDGVTYTYLVENMFEVSPEDIQILEQNESTPYLTLVTCTPPGDPRKPRRLIVRAKIQSSNNAYSNIRN